MIIDLSKARIFIRPGNTDLRKAVNGLSAIVEQQMAGEPFSGNVYLFCNRGRKLLKAVWWDRNGFWLIQKRLEQEKFPWPQTEEEARVRKGCIDNGAFLSERKARAGPVLEKFKAWLLKRKEEVPPSNLLGKAIGYSLEQWGKMTAYLESPYVTPDNNACENAIRPFVLGRKNWLFCQSVDGAKSSCGMFTL